MWTSHQGPDAGCYEEPSGDSLADDDEDYEEPSGDFDYLLAYDDDYEEKPHMTRCWLL